MKIFVAEIFFIVHEKVYREEGSTKRERRNFIEKEGKRKNIEKKKKERVLGCGFLENRELVEILGENIESNSKTNL